MVYYRCTKSVYIISTVLKSSVLSAPVVSCVHSSWWARCRAWRTTRAANIGWMTRVKLGPASEVIEARKQIHAQNTWYRKLGLWVWNETNLLLSTEKNVYQDTHPQIFNPEDQDERQYWRLWIPLYEILTRNKRTYKVKVVCDTLHSYVNK